VTEVVRATFRDGVNPASWTIDGSYQGVMAYVNGDDAWPAEQLERFSAAGLLIGGIDVTGASPSKARVLDVENYDATPAEAGKWVPLRNEIAGDATIYCSRLTVPAVVKAVGPGVPFWLWTADWTGEPHIANLGLIPHVRQAAVQYQNLPGYDLTAVYSSEWLATL
jgi:hypothetical protein